MPYAAPPLSCAAFFVKVQNGFAAASAAERKRGREKASRRRCGLFLCLKGEDSHHQFCLQPFPNVVVYAKIDVPALVVQLPHGEAGYVAAEMLQDNLHGVRVALCRCHNDRIRNKGIFRVSYDKVLFELTEEQKDWELKIGTRVQIVCSDIFQESTPPIGNLISITEAAPNDELKIADEAARAYYENTVFEVISLKLKSQTENGISFSVCVSKGGIVQEPDRTIFLEFVNGHWEVVNEGY